ncbi:restriction endonuclease subunit S [Streptomyces sp. NPDC088196]|uniref:restriction endonuclease subunit S n=1 Tax=Streptomyces sp. NPDC088196 TaxID=3154868 RepID=UPI00344CCD02
MLASPLINGRSVRTQDGGFPVLRLTALQADGIDLGERKEGEWTADEAKPYLVRPDDFLVCRGNGSIALVGRGALVTDVPEPVAFPDTMIRIRVQREHVDPRFLSHLWASPMVRGQLRSLARTSAGIYKISQGSLQDVRFPLPPVVEQRRLAEVVDGRLVRLGAIERMLRHAQTTLERLEMVVMTAASTGLLGSSGSSVPAGLSPVVGVVDGALPDTAPGWIWARLDEIAHVVSGVAKDSKKQDDSGLPEVPYLRAANAQRSWLDLSHITRIRVPEKTLDKLRLRKGDVLMTEGGDRDKLGRGWIWEDQIEDCIHQNHLFRARVQEGATHPKLLSWYVNSAARRWFEVNGKQSVNLASISMSKVKKLPVPIPPSNPSGAQEEAVAVGDRALRHMAVLSSGCREGIQHVADLRRALLAEAFSGRLVPQNPDDEPAEVLLKRIRVEREAAEVERKAARRAARTKPRQASAPAPPPHHRDTPALDGEQTALPLEFSS